MIGPQTFLAYEGYRYLKVALLLVAVAIGAYAVHDPLGGPSGGSWLGYGLGGLATALMFWLMWFGMRKRSYGTSGAPLRGWLSAHVYLGLALLVIIPLHSGFQFGWNLHTLAGGLMFAVILSGIFGIFFYSQIPTPMTRNRPGQKLDGLLEQIADVDGESSTEASGLPDVFAQAVATEIQNTRIGGGVFAQLARSGGKDPTAEALKVIRDHQQKADLDLDGRGRVARLLELLSIKQALVRRVRRDTRYKALLDLWLMLHVPLSFATVAAVLIHIFVVFYYW